MFGQPIEGKETCLEIINIAENFKVMHWFLNAGRAWISADWLIDLITFVRSCLLPQQGHNDRPCYYIPWALTVCKLLCFQHNRWADIWFILTAFANTILYYCRYTWTLQMNALGLSELLVISLFSINENLFSNSLIFHCFCTSRSVCFSRFFIYVDVHD